MKNPVARYCRLGIFGLLALVAGTVQAVPIVVPFTVEVVDSFPSPEFLGATGSGSITYDDSLIAGAGDETLGASEFEVELMLFGQTFTNADDIDSPAFPILGFTDGAIVSLDFVIAEFAFDPLANPVMIDEPNVVVIDMFDVFPVAGAPGLFIPVFVGTPIPAPATIPLMGLAGLIAVRKSKRR